LVSRLLKLIATVVVLAAGGAVALAAGSAPARTRADVIVCPLEPNDTITTPCCGPPIVTAAARPAIACCATASPAINCCATVQPITCPVGMTLSSSKSPSLAGQKITLTGQWTGSASGQTVDLWQKLPGAKAFTKVAHTTTGSLGEFQFVRKGVETNRTWYASVGTEKSAVVDQRVAAVVTVQVSGKRVHGGITPSHAGEWIKIERRAGSRWLVLARRRLSRSSTYAATVSGASLRVVFPGDRRNIRSIGAPSGPVGPY
jgi:hypothetical protein